MTKWKPCPKAGCPVLVTASEPCPTHGRPPNATWSKGRDHAAHARLRRQVIQLRGRRCERCGTTPLTARGLHMHHTKPRNTPDAVILLCEDCHRSIDANAR